MRKDLKTNYLNPNFCVMKMKPTLLLLFMLPVAIFAQTNVTVSDTVQAFSKGTYNSYRVDIPGAKLADVAKSWTEYLKSLKGKLSETNGEYWATGATYKNISPGTVNIYSKLFENNTGVRLTAWLTTDDSIYISKNGNPDQNIAAIKFVREFAISQYQKDVKSDLKEKQSDQKDSEKKLNALVKLEEKNTKISSENKRVITSNTDAIKVNESLIKTKEDAVIKQKGILENAKKAGDGDITKLQQKRYDDDAKELKKLRKENEKLHKQIDKAKINIRNADAKAEQSRKDQKALKAQLETQKANVQSTQQKLNDIK